MEYIDAHKVIIMCREIEVEEDIYEKKLGKIDLSDDIEGLPVEKMEMPPRLMNHPGKCRVCGADFLGYQKNQKTCDEDCRAIWIHCVKFEGEWIRREDKLLLMVERGTSENKMMQEMGYKNVRVLRTMITRAITQKEKGGAVNE